MDREREQELGWEDGYHWLTQFENWLPRLSHVVKLYFPCDNAESRNLTSDLFHTFVSRWQTSAAWASLGMNKRKQRLHGSVAIGSCFFCSIQQDELQWTNAPVRGLGMGSYQLDHARSSDRSIGCTMRLMLFALCVCVLFYNVCV